MCFYIPILHLHCGCTTFELPVPNPCNYALKNSMPCLYIPGSAFNPMSLDLAQRFSYTVSTVSRRSDSSWQTCDSTSSLIAQIEAPKEVDVVMELTLCEFHKEDRLEIRFWKSGREEVGLAHRIGVKKRAQERLRKEMREIEYEMSELEYDMEEMESEIGEKKAKKTKKESPQRK
jgi:hypothetical protein